MTPQIPDVKQLHPLRGRPLTISFRDLEATFYLVDSFNSTAPKLRIELQRREDDGLCQIWCNADGKIVDYDGVAQLGLLAPMLVALGYEFNEEDFYDSETGAFNG
jgi:hypothetical protein